MARNSAINLDVRSNADGFQISGGLTGRLLRVSGGDVTLQGGGTIINGNVLIGNTTENSFNQGHIRSGVGISITSGANSLTISVDGTITRLQSQIDAVSSGAVIIEAGSTVRDGEILVGAANWTGYDQGDLLAGTGIIVISGSGTLLVGLKQPSFNLQTGTGYALTINDASNYISMTYSGNNFIVVQTTSQVAFSSGMEFAIAQKGTGTTALTGVAGVTINSRGAAMRSAGQHAVFGLINESGNTWLAYGDLVV